MDLQQVYLLITVVLILLAISDIVVGVTNDAVNFLNSAIGSKVASYRVIMIVASLGVFLGASFSSGMMEVARSGIFRPEMFAFHDVMLIFLAVMLTDVILLDFFNTYGLPTSTTVSLIFELLGATVALSVLKIIGAGGQFGELAGFINTGKVFAIISGIFISIVVAFGCGLLIQFLTRLLFTFNLNRTFRYFGSLWSGLAITSIFYFILLKGIKGWTFIEPSVIAWIYDHTWLLVAGSIAFWTMIFQAITSLLGFNVLRIIVLAGTFALALAFASNDLVNFIGVPLAGFESYRTFLSHPGALPESLNMGHLNEAVRTPLLFLLISGLVMVITLWVSKKARTVSDTEVSLSRQQEGYERFPSTALSRSIVRASIQLAQGLRAVLPDFLNRWMDRRLNPPEKRPDDPAAFDLLRASVNLMVSSTLIASGTWLKLPLSTTYVTFIVAMATSLSDGAWGRESAVYRVSGVLTVIGGWFFTAFVAFTGAFLVAAFLFKAGFVAMILMVALVAYLLIKSNILHKRKARLREEEEKELILPDDRAGAAGQSNALLAAHTQSLVALYGRVHRHFTEEKRKQLKKALLEVMELNQQTKKSKKAAQRLVSAGDETYLEFGIHLIQAIESLREAGNALRFIAEPLYSHLDNNHPGFSSAQQAGLDGLLELVEAYGAELARALQQPDPAAYPQVSGLEEKINAQITSLKRKNIKMLQNGEVSSRTGVLCLDILNESKNLVQQLKSMFKSAMEYSQAGHLTI